MVRQSYYAIACVLAKWGWPLGVHSVMGVLDIVPATAVSAYVTHGVFPNFSWMKFKADTGGE
jgi:hypothetical protein